ncbi:MAG: CoA transferase [Anaerolineales bacterium]|nr:CoA transferase [Anaerolineales bacterium]
MPDLAPLDGILVLDMTRLLPGGMCTLLLADMGADVIKVEEPEIGDHFRLHPPFRNGISIIHLLLNRDKRSLAVDLKHPDGKKLLLQLVEKAVVLVESFRPGVMERLELDYPVLRRINPRLVYCSISGFGQSSPHRDRPGHDLDYTALSGLLALSAGEKETPKPFGVPAADYTGAWSAAASILAALLACEKTGQGSYLDISLADSVFTCGHPAIAEYLGGMPPEEDHIPFWGGAPYYRAYRTAGNGTVTVSNYEPKFWRNFCLALNRPDLVDCQYATGRKRQEIIDFIERTMLTRSQEEWEAFFIKHDCCGMVVNDIDRALSEPHFWQRGLISRQEHPNVGEILQINSPLGGLENPGSKPAPALGQHSPEILASLNYTPDDIASLAASGAISLPG